MTQAFPRTSDDRTVEDVDRHIKEANLRAVQEVGLPPLLTDEQIDALMPQDKAAPGADHYECFTRAEMREAIRTAIAAAGGGVPKANSIQRRAASLHSKTGMSWDEAEQLALSEAGIDDEAIDELIGECGYSGLESLLTTPDELRRFTRSVLVHQPLASSPQPEAAPAVAQVPQDDKSNGPLLDGEGWAITLADGHSGHGWYAHCEDYPEEGAVFIAAAPEAPAQAAQWNPPPLTCPRSNRSDCALFGASIRVNSAKGSDHG